MLAKAKLMKTHALSARLPYNCKSSIRQSARNVHDSTPRFECSGKTRAVFNPTTTSTAIPNYMLFVRPLRLRFQCQTINARAQNFSLQLEDMKCH